MKLTLHVLGKPYAEIDGKRLSLPLRKAEAMLFYVALEGRMLRDRLKLLFWGDKDEEQASNNLRNAVYLLRKALPANFLVDRRYVQLQDYRIDTDEIDALANPAYPIRQDCFGEPLRGFDTLGSPELDEWLALTRGDVRKRLIAAIRARIAACYEAELSDELADSISALLVFEPFDEDSILELMEVHRNMGYAAKAVSLYRDYRGRIASEIGIQPSHRAEEFYRRLVAAEEQNVREKLPGEFFCCREREIRKILDLSDRSGNRSLFILLHGEAGVGKTALVNRAVHLTVADGQDLYTLRPHAVGENYPYSSWSGIVSQFSSKIEKRGLSLPSSALFLLSGVFYDFAKGSRASHTTHSALTDERNPVTIGKILADLVARLVLERPVFVMEDLHWFDPQSFELLRTFLSELAIPVTVFLTSRPERAAEATEVLYALKTPTGREVATIPLSSFDENETLRFCRSLLPEHVIAHRGPDYFIRRSEGLPLLLVEMLRTLSDNPDADPSEGLDGVIMSRMAELSSKQRDFLTVLSAFGRGARIEDIAAAMGEDPSTLVKLIENLLRKKFIHEIQSDGRFLVDFSHTNVRDCVYGAIPGFRRKDLHSRIAEVLSIQYSPQVWNPELSSMLCHHYTMAGMRVQELCQHLQEMSFHITLNHTLFPLVQDKVLLSCSIPFSGREETEYKIGQVRALLRDLEEAAPPAAECTGLQGMEASFLEIWGGYLINWGDYREGRMLINRALSLADDGDFDEIRMYCVEHIGHHFLQTDNSEKLLAAAREILLLAGKLRREHHMGLALRFIGMAMMIDRNFERAEKVFRRSIELFEDLSLMGRCYTLNLLAPHCYIGEIRQWTGDPDAAMRQFEHCIGRCRDAGFFWGRSHFHAHAADVAIDMGDWNLVRRHVDAGTTLFESSKGGHCGSLLYSLKAILDASDARWTDAAISLENGDRLSAIEKRTWRASQNMAKAWVASLMERENVRDERLAALLPLPSAKYAEISRDLYRTVGATIRADFVERRFFAG